jgi:hypothetical protein
MHRLFILLLVFVSAASMVTSVNSFDVADFSTSIITLRTTSTQFLNDTYYIFYWTVSHCPTNNTVRVLSTSTIVAHDPRGTFTYSTVTTILSPITTSSSTTNSTTLTPSFSSSKTYNQGSTSTGKGSAADIGPAMAMAFIGLGLAAVPIGVGLGLGLGKSTGFGRRRTDCYPTYCYLAYCYPTCCYPTYCCPTYPTHLLCQPLPQDV